jgi:hypothetical protein
MIPSVKKDTFEMENNMEDSVSLLFEESSERKTSNMNYDGTVELHENGD